MRWGRCRVGVTTGGPGSRGLGQLPADVGHQIRPADGADDDERSFVDPGQPGARDVRAVDDHPLAGHHDAVALEQRTGEPVGGRRAAAQQSARGEEGRPRRAGEHPTRVDTPQPGADLGVAVAAEPARHDDHVDVPDAVEDGLDALRSAGTADDAEAMPDGQHARPGHPGEHVPERPALVGQHALVGDDGDPQPLGPRRSRCPCPEPGRHRQDLLWCDPSSRTGVLRSATPAVGTRRRAAGATMGRWPPTRVAVVLGAGGTVGHAFHAGVLAALHHELGWDARHADLVVGTSAGSVVAALLRAGLPAADLARRAPAPAAVAGGCRASSPRPSSACPAAGAPAAGRARPDGLAGPAGPAPCGHPGRSAPGRWRPPCCPRDASRRRTSPPRSTPSTATQWPADPMWIVAVELDSGRRVVFGRDGCADGHAGRGRPGVVRHPGLLRAGRRSTGRATSTAACTRRPTPTSSPPSSPTWCSSARRCRPPAACATARPRRGHPPDRPAVAGPGGRRAASPRDPGGDVPADGRRPRGDGRRLARPGQAGPGLRTGAARPPRHRLARSDVRARVSAALVSSLARRAGGAARRTRFRWACSCPAAERPVPDDAQRPTTNRTSSFGRAIAG